MMAKSLLAFFLSLLVGTTFSGCAQTYLSGGSIGEEYIRLAAAAPTPVTALMEIEPEELTLGRQWVFGVMPLGRIATADESQLISTTLFKRLALRGYSPTILPRRGLIELNHSARHHITISDAAVSCSVPDLFFIRIVRCSMTIRGSTSLAPELTLQSSGESSNWRMLGFRPQLEAALEQASARALDGLLNQMHL